MQKIKLLLADDHHLFLEGIKSLLKEENDLEIVHIAINGNEVLFHLKKGAVDICILDINMPELDGIETAREIKKNHSDIRIIILTTYNDKEFIKAMLELGVEGYVMKNVTKTELVKAIHEVWNGKKYFANDVHEAVFKDFLDKRNFSEEKIILTQRETEIVQLLAQQLTNDQIAEKLHISFRTVETHRKNIMQKTKASNLAGLIRFAYENKMIT
jgi:DNA-binding NarL/FixJ family response regulator